MESTPFFSIVIPTYNRAGFILNTLDTVFSQKFTNYEVIVVDNCSTDNTLELLQPLVNKGKIKFIQHDKNYERAKSRNTGMKNAHGKYLTFLDSDDFMYPDNLQDAYDFIKKNPNTKVFHNLYELVNEKKEKVYGYNFQKLTNPLKQIAEGNFLSCIGVFLHQEVYQSISWDETPQLTGSEDYEFWLRVIGNYPDLGRIDKVNSGILDHPNRSVNTLQISQAETRFEYFIKKLEKDGTYQNSYANYLHKIKATLYIFLAGMAKEANDLLAVRKYKKRAYKADKSIIFRRNYQHITLYLLKRKFKLF